MPRIEVSGVSIYYEEHGKGFPIVLTHGYAGTTRMWDGQIAAFSRRHRLITWDLRGHGQTDSPPDSAQYSTDLLVEDLYHLLRSLGIDKAVVGGLSYGGYHSLQFYHQHPEMVQALMLIDTGPGYRSPESASGWNARCEARAAVLEARGMAEFLSGEPAMLNYYTSRELMLTLNARGLANFSRVAMVNPHGVDRLKDVAVPTLIIVGERDTDFLAAASYMAERIPNAQKAVIANAGHAPTVDQPAELEAVVLGFLGRVGV